MSRKWMSYIFIVALMATVLAVNACTSQQQAENQAINAVDATADAARLKVNQFIGYSQALIDQLAAQAGNGPEVEARANEIKYALDDVSGALNKAINASEENKMQAMGDVQDSLDKAIETVQSVAKEAEDPQVQQRLNDMADELEQLRSAVVDLINQQTK